jgi:hypothetical protein
MTSKIQIAAFSALLFYVIANPITYSVVDALLRNIGIKVAINGKPTGSGLVLHSLVFGAATLALMSF